MTLSEILDETHQLDVDSKTKYWLENEALRNNPKISASIGTGRDGSTTYLFKPPFHIKTRKALLKLLKQYSIKGKGGILLDDLQESLPNCDKVIRQLEDKDEIWKVKRPADKKEVVYYHDNRGVAIFLTRMLPSHAKKLKRYSLITVWKLQKFTLTLFEKNFVKAMVLLK